MYTRVIKRTLDLILSLFAIVVLSPVFLIAAIGIRISSPGPVFYYSDRMGMGRKPFHFYKFRSMHVANGNQKNLYIADEERLFWFGKVIRRLKIDELPQLVNVIKGDMSIVGPRPMPVSSVDETYYGEYQAILTVKPGLTSPASLYDYVVGDAYTDDQAYRVEVLPVKLKMELLYIKKQSFIYDAMLVCRTVQLIFAVFLGKKEFKEMPEYTQVKVEM